MESTRLTHEQFMRTNYPDGGYWDEEEKDSDEPHHLHEEIKPDERSLKIMEKDMEARRRHTGSFWLNSRTK
jgi:hypothetical protein